jgi:hypothetical protein
MYPGTMASTYASYYNGSIAFLRGNYELSAMHFRTGIQSGKIEEVMPFLLREGLAQALEAKGDFVASSKAYQDAAAFATGSLKTQAMMGQARVLGLSGRKREAEGLYRLILSGKPDPQAKEFIEIKLAQTE